MLITGLALWLFGWLWTVWRGFGVSIICGLLNFFFPPLSQLIFCLYEKRLRAPTLLIFFGFALTVYSCWQGIHAFINHQPLPPGGVMVHAGPAPHTLRILLPGHITLA